MFIHQVERTRLLAQCAAAEKERASDKKSGKIERVAESKADYRTYVPRDYTSTLLMGVRYVPLVQGPDSTLRP